MLSAITGHSNINSGTWSSMEMHVNCYLWHTSLETLGMVGGGRWWIHSQVLLKKGFLN